MNIERARGLAAQCWCDPRTSATVMDPVLVEVFAERLMHLVNASEALYMAGRWTLSEGRIITEEQAELWEDMRSALGLEPGHSTRAGFNTVEIVSGKTISITS